MNQNGYLLKFEYLGLKDEASLRENIQILIRMTIKYGGNIIIYPIDREDKGEPVFVHISFMNRIRGLEKRVGIFLDKIADFKSFRYEGFVNT